MTRTATKTRSSRIENKRLRQERREEIQHRWHTRLAWRIFHEDLARTPSVNVRIGILLHLGKWIPRDDMMGYFDDDELRTLVARLLRIVELKEMDYQEYLQTDEWTARAARAKLRYDGRCALDDSHPAEHAHHRTYARRGREWDTDIIPLCAACHSRFHERAR